MVTRKPFGPPVNTSNKPNPPYPTSPIASAASDKQTHSINSIYSPDLSTSPAFDLIDMNDARQRTRRDSDVSSHGTWDSADDEDEERRTPEEADIPKPLRISPSKQNMSEQAERDGKKDELPASLRPGPANGALAVRVSQESLRYEEEANANPWVQAAQKTADQVNGKLESNNPYLRQQPTGESSQEAWGDVRSPPPQNAPSAPPVELPSLRSPTDEMSKMSLGGAVNGEPFHTAEVMEVPSVGRSPLPPVVEQRSGGSSSSNPWRQQQQPAPEQKYDDRQSYPPPPGPPPKAPATQELQQRPPTNSLIERLEQESAPYLPPRNDQLPSQPPRPGPISTQISSAAPLNDSVPETPGTRAKRQRSEHYQIKHINWFDASYSSDPRMKTAMRQSPILTQNANGPCPLLALVNALVLSTPSNVHTALIETLQTREQVSLGLLLDAVFDELMSGRRGETAHALPDVGELYAFLLALHTGMNVNPRFVTPATAPRGSLDGHPPDMNGIHPAERAQSKAGCFEETKEMGLYSTFNVPLIHGWTPPRNTPAYNAFERSAPTFEDAQNIQFAESELEHKLQQEGLDGPEQQQLQDIQTIKQFLANWPTQLTEHGLHTISATLRPGQIAILFRNDHFSTIYKEPNHGALMTLVTDAGYSSHDEIVWESLVDVNGAASEMFSGDFRIVSHDQEARLNQSSTGGGDGGEGWTTVPESRIRYHGQRQRPNEGPLKVTNGAPGSSAAVTPISPEGPAPPLPGPRPTSRQEAAASSEDTVIVAPQDVARSAAEQEDHDLALALQLQEEEEDQQRQAEQRRRREQELSEQYLSTEGDRPNQRPAIPPRRNGRGGGAVGCGRPAVNRPMDTSDPEAPPTYEQAASDRPYREAGSTAPPQQGNPLSAYEELRRQQAGFNQSSMPSANTSGPPGTHARRRSDGNRVRRRSSQFGVPQPGGGMSGAPVRHAQGPNGYPGGLGSGMAGATNPNRRTQSHQGQGQAATVQDADERCVVM